MIFYLLALTKINDYKLLSNSFKENIKEKQNNKQKTFFQHFKNNQFLQNNVKFQQNKLSWSDFFEGSMKKQIYHKESGDHLTPKESNNYIVYSYFIKTKTQQNGGAIFTDNKKNVNYLIESSSFISCYAADTGGALCLKLPAEIILNKICGNSCSVKNVCNFADCYLNYKDATYNNYFISSSLTKSSGYGYTTDHQYGQIMHSECNFTYNSGDYASVIFDQPAQKGKNPYGIIKYSTLSNNTSKGHAILMFDRESPSVYQIEFSNIVYNKQSQTYYSLLYFISECTIRNTCITNNDCSSIFQNTKETTILYNCTVDKKHLKSIVGKINTKSLGPFGRSFYNHYSYIQNDVCHITTPRTKIFNKPGKQINSAILN